MTLAVGPSASTLKRHITQQLSSVPFVSEGLQSLVTQDQNETQLSETCARGEKVHLAS